MKARPQLVRNYDSVLIEEARACARRAKRARTSQNHRLHAGATFSAVVAGVSALEAYLSELLEHNRELGVLSEREVTRVLAKQELWTRLTRLSKAFDGDLSRWPRYNELRALTKLRHALVHRNADFLRSDEWPEELQDCHNFIPQAQGKDLDWTSKVLHADAAMWAYKLAWEAIKQLHEVVIDPAYLPQPTSGD